MELNTPKRIKTVQPYANSTPNNDYCVFSPNEFINYTHLDGSSPSLESSPCESPEFIVRQQINTSGSCGSSQNGGSDLRGENRRGRPRSEALSTLIFEGTTSPSAIKCGFCNRVFPREKSLQAHLRTHTGERPYTCDYPGCTRAFTQSGQLKTHQRLHTGERPFVCSAPSCQMRFTHANRHCPDHPYDQLKRCDDFVIQSVPEQNSEVIKWLEKYRMDRQEKTPTRKTPKRTKHDNNNENSYGEESASKSTNENNEQFPVTPNNQFKSRKGLMVELDMNAGLVTSPLTGKQYKPLPKLIQWNESLNQDDDSDGDEIDDIPAQSTFNPKKRWIREAWQDLAKPLETTTTTTNPNQNRPTVLMVASKDKTMPLIEIQNKTMTDTSLKSTGSMEKNFHLVQSQSSPVYHSSVTMEHQPPVVFDENRKWLGALALMELAAEDGVGVGSGGGGGGGSKHNSNPSTEPTHIHHNNSVIQSYTQL